MKRLALAVLFVGCGGTAVAPTPLNPITPVPTVVPAPVKVSKAWQCQGTITPPTGYLHATGTAAAGPEGPAVAGRQALSTLRNNVCGAGCGLLAAEFKVWKTGQGSGQACAMAVVKRSKVEQWRATDQGVGDLHTQLTEAARTLVGSLQIKKPKITVARIVDAGAMGGPRARWLLPQLHRAFDEAGAVPVVGIKWTPNKVPKGVDGVVDASLTQRTEGGKAVLELIIELERRVGGMVARKAAKAILFPEAAAPPVGTALPDLPYNPGIKVQFSAGEGGVLCAGARTQLTLKTDENLFVTVLSLYGKDEALVMLPPTQVRAGQLKVLGEAEALPVPGTNAERVLVLGAPTRAGLGRFAKITEACRLPKHSAAPLHSFKKIPKGARFTADGYRIVEGDGCPQLNPEARTRIASALKGLPLCK